MAKKYANLTPEDKIKAVKICKALQEAQRLRILERTKARMAFHKSGVTYKNANRNDAALLNSLFGRETIEC